MVRFSAAAPRESSQRCIALEHHEGPIEGYRKHQAVAQRFATPCRKTDEYINALQKRFDYLLLLRLQCRRANRASLKQASAQYSSTSNHLQLWSVRNQRCCTSVHENQSIVSRHISLAFPRREKKTAGSRDWVGPRAGWGPGRAAGWALTSVAAKNEVDVWAELQLEPAVAHEVGQVNLLNHARLGLAHVLGMGRWQIDKYSESSSMRAHWRSRQLTCPPAFLASRSSCEHIWDKLSSSSISSSPEGGKLPLVAALLDRRDFLGIGVGAAKSASSAFPRERFEPFRELEDAIITDRASDIVPFPAVCSARAIGAVRVFEPRQVPAKVTRVCHWPHVTGNYNSTAHAQIAIFASRLSKCRSRREGLSRA